MKAILMIDMPNNCAECQFCGFGGKNLEKYVCCLTREHNKEPHLVGCPLKPMPKKEEADDNDGWHEIDFKEGWNACLDEIMGETE